MYRDHGKGSSKLGLIHVKAHSKCLISVCAIISQLSPWGHGGEKKRGGRPWGFESTGGGDQLDEGPLGWEKEGGKGRCGRDMRFGCPRGLRTGQGRG